MMNKSQFLNNLESNSDNLNNCSNVLPSFLANNDLSFMLSSSNNLNDLDQQLEMQKYFNSTLLFLACKYSLNSLTKIQNLDFTELDSDKINTLDTNLLNKELVEILNQIKILIWLFEKKMNGRQHEIEFNIKQEFISQLEKVYRCLLNIDYQDNFEKKNNTNDTFKSYFNLISENNFLDKRNSCLRKLKKNSKNLKLPSINLNEDICCDDLKRNTKLNSFFPLIEDVNSNINHKNEIKFDSFNNEKFDLNNNQVLLDEQLNVEDQFIIDNRKNLNQNRIKSSILGAAKHLKNKKKIMNNDNASNLIDSEDLESKIKRCVCPFCNQTFTQRNSLNRHIRSHTGEKPFPCNFCGKSFSDKQRLLIHTRIHTGEKPFSCSICNRQFTQKSTVKRHLIVHFGGTTNADFNNALNLKKKSKTVKKML